MKISLKGERMYAKIVIDLKNNNINDYYDYSIPDELLEFIDIGSRVLVPFGFQDILGYVIELSESSDYEKNIKTIKEVLDFEKELTYEQVALARDLSEKYQVSIVSALELMMPSFLKGQKRNFLIIKDYNLLHPSLAVLFEGKKRLLIDKKILNQYDLIKKEISKGNVTIDYDLYSYGKNKKKKQYYVKTFEPQKTKKRQNILIFIQENNNCTQEMIVMNTGSSLSLLKKMMDDGIIGYNEVVVHEEIKQNRQCLTNHQFSFDQSQTLERYENSKQATFLLFSNDDKFKINFYLYIIESNAKKGLSTVILTPTIMMSSEIYLYISRVLRGYNIINLNSYITKAEEYDAYMNIKYHNFDVLVTTITGIFAPYNNIGTFIVIDEENTNYIKETYPYYNAVDVLEFRRKYQKIKMLLTSSSPSINSYYKSEMGEYNLLTSGNKIKGNVELVDMRKELSYGGSSVISKSLQRSMADAIDNRKQIMLIVNNLGFSNLMQCRSCMKVMKCPTCGVSLTFYKEKNIVRCHYCDYKIENYHKCNCGGENIQSLGYGIEKVVEIVSEMFPNNKILHIDSTTMKSNDDYEESLFDIEEGNYDIIIGTSILSKCLDNSNIEVVGLLSADRLLNINDYRANEYTYNNIAKIISKPNVFIQTYYFDNTIIKYACNGDYDNYYIEEIARRELLKYAPFWEVNRVIISGEYKQMYHFANYYKKVFRNIIGDTILGPTYDYKAKGIKMILKHQNFERVQKILEDTKRTFEKDNLLISFERNPRIL